jgi:hypothetical protein
MSERIVVPVTDYTFPSLDPERAVLTPLGAEEAARALRGEPLRCPVRV